MYNILYVVCIIVCIVPKNMLCVAGGDISVCGGGHKVICLQLGDYAR